jgi:hypothetical protein
MLLLTHSSLIWAAWVRTRRGCRSMTRSRVTPFSPRLLDHEIPPPTTGSEMLVSSGHGRSHFRSASDRLPIASRTLEALSNEGKAFEAGRPRASLVTRWPGQIRRFAALRARPSPWHRHSERDQVRASIVDAAQCVQAASCLWCVTAQHAINTSERSSCNCVRTRTAPPNSHRDPSRREPTAGEGRTVGTPRQHRAGSRKHEQHLRGPQLAIGMRRARWRGALPPSLPDPAVEGALVMERLSVHVHDPLPVGDRPLASAAAARASSLGLRERHRRQPV